MSDEPIENAPVVYSGNPLDVPSDVFSAALTRRGANRKAMMSWISDNLQEGRDYYVIQGRKSMGKPGAEKICGMLGLKVVFPSLKDYEQSALENRPINEIILRCHVLDAQDRIVADGVGARSVEKDRGDLNKALKMAEKSAMIDAVLRCGGLSEVFTQDVEDMATVDTKPPPPTGHAGKSGADYANSSERKATEKQVKLVNHLLSEFGVPVDEFRNKYGIERLEDLPFSSVNSAIDWLKSFGDVPQ